MRIAMHICPTKFLYVRRQFKGRVIRILDVGCGNNSPSTTKHWFPGCHYSGADIERYNNSDADIAAIDTFYLLRIDGSGYAEIPNHSYDLILLHHVIEHMPDAAPILAQLCSKLKPGGYIWIAFPSVRTLSLPPAAKWPLQFCDDSTHVHVPCIREVSNVLLTNGTKILHAGRSRDFIRELIGAAMLPIAMLQKLFTGGFSAKGLWYIVGFEDHVLGQRRQS